MERNAVESKLKRYGWKSLSDSTLKRMKKEDLVQIIRNLENNYAVAISRLESQYDFCVNNIDKRLESFNGSLLQATK